MVDIYFCLYCHSRARTRCADHIR